MRKLVLVGILLSLLALGGAGRVDAGEEASWLDVDARLDEALTTFERGDMVPAIQQLTAVAEAGNSQAQYFLGRLYSEGFGVAKDYCRSLVWLQRAADNGDVEATVNLGVFYQFAHCVPIDTDKAIRYFQKAVDLGSEGAYLGISILHFYEKWGRRDLRLAYETAIRAWDENRNENNEIAMFAALMLGQLYEDDSGIDRDLKEAKRYYSYAAHQGLAAAQYSLGELQFRHENLFSESEALIWIFVAAEQEFERAVEFREMIAEELHAVRFANFQNAARDELRRISESNTQLGDAAEWCREFRPESYDCLRFAFADRDNCDPSITEVYFKTRYMHSDAYNTCRREVFEARFLGASQK